MEYGRLVVLGYSSYRVASVQAPPRSENLPRSQSSFGLGVASSSSDNNGSDDAEAQSSASRTTAAPPRSLGSSISAATNGNYSSSKKSLGQLWEPIGDQNAQYILQRRKRANGVALTRFHHFRSTVKAKSSSSSSSHARSKDIQAVTTRMMQSIDEQRVRDAEALTHNDNNVIHSSDASTDTRSSAATAPRDASAYLMCVPMNGSDAHASVTEYALDPTRDMFQIGRLPCRQNDFVIPGPRVGASGTISRFAARIVCARAPPYECRLYAGGFDVQRKMTTAGHALKYCAGCSAWFKKLPLDHSCVAGAQLPTTRRASNQASHIRDDSARASLSASSSTALADMNHTELAMSDSSDVPIDGVTKNGVRVWLPEHKQWFEVSVNGNLYAIENRTASSSSSSARALSSSSSSAVVRHSTFNRPVSGSDGVPPILTDGAIIDLGGVQLQFQTTHRAMPRTGERLSLSDDDSVAGRRTESSVVAQLERLNVQCPVQLHTLRFTRAESSDDAMDPIEIPHVFPACGHVFGYEERIASSQVCPLCRHPGFLVKLLLKENSQLQSAAERNAIPECVLNPCGHAISRKLAAHYSKLLMPNGRAICPFCAVHLHPTTPYSRLYLYSEETDELR